MKKYCLRIIALVMSIVLIVSICPASLLSREIVVRAEQKKVNRDNATKDSKALSNLKPFTSTEDLIASMKKELLQNGDTKTVAEDEEQQLQVLSDKIEKKCGFTLTEVKSLLAISIFQERDKDKIDVSKYNLSKEDIATIIELVLKDYNATDTIDVTVKADSDGIARTIRVDMKKGFEAGLDALDEIDGVGEIYPATEKLEEKETASTLSFKETKKSTTSLGDTSGIPIVTSEVIEGEVKVATPGAVEGEVEVATPGAIVCETHTYGEPTFTWSEINIDNEIPYTCTASFTCSKCNKVTTVDCTVTKDEEVTDAVIYKAICKFEDKEYSTTRDATTEQLYAHWGRLCSFYGQSAEYYGTAAEYWTAKTTKNNPFGALKVLAGFDIDTEVPAPNMDELISGITQAFQAYVYYYGDALIAARNEALKMIDDSMTDLQKCLVLHDYLATQAVFDLGTLLDIQNGEKQSDPITMTPFAALLYGKIDGLDGSVCLGYASTYTYLIQCAFPNIYRDDQGNFKDYEDVIGNNSDMVDFVMIKYDCDVQEVGVTGGKGGFEGRFTEPHYFNVVKLDGKWYNVDVCYDDIKTEALTQYRVETDGNCSHMYFLVSQQTLEEWYDGYYQYIDTLHGTNSTEPCNDEQYEDAWFSNVDSPISYDNQYWYYVEAQFSDLDLKDMMGDDESSGMGDIFSNMDSDQLADMMKDKGDLLKARPRSAEDSSDEGTVLFDYGKGTETSIDGTKTEEGKLEADCNDDIQLNNIYPDLTHSVSLFDNTLYFNIANKIYMYDLDDATVTQLKEYNTVYAKSQGTAVTGSAIYITNAGDENLKYTIKNHPLAALCIKNDGIMYVSVATTYSNSECSNYEKESVNYNPMYNRFAENKSEDDNDNSEFMWCANVKDNINMSDVTTYLSGGSKLENVEVEPWCDKSGYTESREITHGFSSGTGKADFTDAKEHHYIFNEEEGCYICIRCHKALDKEKAEENNIKVGHTYGEPVFSWKDLEGGGYSCTATFTCDYGDDEQTIDATVTSIDDITPGDSDCKKQKKTVYTATCVFEEKTYTDTKETGVEQVVMHTYGEPEFSWVSTTASGYTCDAIFTCKGCKDQQKVSCTVTSQTKGNEIIYTATCNFNNKTYSNTKTVPVNSQPTVPVDPQPPVPVNPQPSVPTDPQPQGPGTVSKPITNLEILNNTIKLGKNKSIKLELQVTPSDTTETELKFTSSNDTIATVSNKGIVTGHQTGTATITVSTVDGRLKRTVNVEVGEPVVSLELNHTKLDLVIKETSLLSVTIKPDNAITKEVLFTSLDESIATVDSKGNVTAVGVGKTQIIAKSMDGSEITAKCYVTVKQKTNNLTISSIVPQTYTGRAIKPEIIIKDGNYQLQDGKDYSLKWKNNTNIGKATITLVGKGNYTGTKKIYFIIKPSKVTLSSVKGAKSTTAVVAWKPIKGVTGYQVFYATSEKGSYKAVGKTSKLSYTLKKQKSNSTIYVKVRAYKKIDGKNVYGAYSNVIKVKVK